MNILGAIKGVGGEPEIIRTSGAFGLVAYVLSTIAFTGWNMSRGEQFDVTAFCLAFSGGLVAIYGAIAGAVALKDRNVATARATQAATDTVDQANPAAKGT